MSYQIKRECWNEKTYNGYTDSPYWRIETNGLSFGLKDSGEYWMIGNNRFDNPAHTLVIKEIVLQCNINIKKIKPLKH